jgi:hypothetical protein
MAEGTERRISEFRSVRPQETNADPDRESPSPLDSITKWREIRARTGVGDGALAPELRSTVWERHAGDYDPPTEAQERVETLPKERHSHPAGWVEAINPGGPRGPLGYAEDPRRERNCADCSRAVERNWRGEAQVAAGLVPFGETNERVEAWCGERFSAARFEDIHRRLAEAGPGASAIVGVDWKGAGGLDGGGHFFNALNFQGRILAVDGQTGAVGEWPPSRDVFGFDESHVQFSEAIIRDREGRIVR